MPDSPRILPPALGVDRKPWRRLCASASAARAATTADTLIACRTPSWRSRQYTPYTWRPSPASAAGSATRRDEPVVAEARHAAAANSCPRLGANAGRLAVRGLYQPLGPNATFAASLGQGRNCDVTVLLG